MKQHIIDTIVAGLIVLGTTMHIPAAQASNRDVYMAVDICTLVRPKPIPKDRIVSLSGPIIGGAQQAVVQRTQMIAQLKVMCETMRTQKKILKALESNK